MPGVLTYCLYRAPQYGMRLRGAERQPPAGKGFPGEPGTCRDAVEGIVALRADAGVSV